MQTQAKNHSVYACTVTTENSENKVTHMTDGKCVGVKIKTLSTLTWVIYY